MIFCSHAQKDDIHVYKLSSSSYGWTILNRTKDDIHVYKPSSSSYGWTILNRTKDDIHVYKPSSSSYGWTILNRTKVKCLIHPVVKLQKGHYKMSVGHASIAPENPECYLRPCCLKVKLTFKLTNSSQYSDTLEDL